jgi:AmiR/NasT family two-component response regulator
VPEQDVYEQLQRAEQEVVSLRAALDTRELIGIAKGMLMMRYGLDDDQAFGYLARISQDSNVKLREVARGVIDELRQTGWPEQAAPST